MQLGRDSQALLTGLTTLPFLGQSPLLASRLLHQPHHRDDEFGDHTHAGNDRQRGQSPADGGAGDPAHTAQPTAAVAQTSHR